MKKAFLILGAVAVSAAAGGLTAWAVAGGREGSVQYIEREVERTPALGTQFTSYQAEQYPDLTYAAENAVKAVVNIEAVQQVEMPRRRGYDPFLEFFGIPQCRTNRTSDRSIPMPNALVATITGTRS